MLEGGHLACMTCWHGAILDEWANRWVEYRADGAADYVASAMEETGSFQAIEYLGRIGRVDRDRFMVRRAVSNCTMPAKGLTAAGNLLLERKGCTGMQGALESLHLVGTKVIDTLLGDWETTRDGIPGTPGG